MKQRRQESKNSAKHDHVEPAAAGEPKSTGVKTGHTSSNRNLIRQIVKEDAEIIRRLADL